MGGPHLLQERRRPNNVQGKIRKGGSPAVGPTKVQCGRPTIMPGFGHRILEESDLLFAQPKSMSSASPGDGDRMAINSDTYHRDPRGAGMIGSAFPAEHYLRRERGKLIVFAFTVDGRDGHHQDRGYLSDQHQLKGDALRLYPWNTMKWRCLATFCLNVEASFHSIAFICGPPAHA